jgi:hypothetical protein
MAMKDFPTNARGYDMDLGGAHDWGLDDEDKGPAPSPIQEEGPQDAKLLDYASAQWFGLWTLVYFASYLAWTFARRRFAFAKSLDSQAWFWPILTGLTTYPLARQAALALAHYTTRETETQIWVGLVCILSGWIVASVTVTRRLYALLERIQSRESQKKRE